MTRSVSAKDIELVAAKARWEQLFEMRLDYEDRLTAYMETLTPEQLAQVRFDADLFGSTNCGWYEFTAMHHAAAEARWRLRRIEEGATS